MAERRMLAKTVIRSDAFMELPLTSQALYVHMNLEADDDGFINNPNMIQRMVGASTDDLKLLFAKGFLIKFDSGVVVVRDWKIHNYIQKDRYKETQYLEEKSFLKVKKNKAYSLTEGECIQNVSKLDTQSRVSLESGQESQESVKSQFSLGQSIEDGLTQLQIVALHGVLKDEYDSFIYYIDRRLKKMPDHPYKYALKCLEEWRKER